MRHLFFAVPLFLPAVVVFCIVAALASRAVAHHLRVGPRFAFLLVASLGLTIAATLTPDSGALLGQEGPGSCDLRRLWFADLGALLQVNEVSGNVALFIPLGVMLGLLPRGGPRTAMLVGALSVPFVIEGVQSLFAELGRGCQSADVFDNLMGLIIGFGVGSIVGFASKSLRRARTAA